VDGPGADRPLFACLRRWEGVLLVWSCSGGLVGWSGLVKVQVRAGLAWFGTGSPGQVQGEGFWLRRVIGLSRVSVDKVSNTFYRSMGPRTKAGQRRDDLGKEWTRPRTRPGPKQETWSQQAAARVGGWPSGRVGKRNGLAAGHARSVWETARTGVVGRADGLAAEVAGDRRSFAGQVDLAFLATVGGHMRRCDSCWAVWIDQEVPGELLTAAVRRIPAWEVFRPVVAEIRAARGRSGQGRRGRR
jgi:hypothetical protein